MAQGSVSTTDKAVVEKALAEARQYLKEVTNTSLQHATPLTTNQITSHHITSHHITPTTLFILTMLAEARQYLKEVTNTHITTTPLTTTLYQAHPTTLCTSHQLHYSY